MPKSQSNRRTRRSPISVTPVPTPAVIRPSRLRSGILAAVLLLTGAALVSCDDATDRPTEMREITDATQSEATPELVAVFEQKSGVIRARLAVDRAPRTCLSFINLVERGYFTGRTWGDFSTVVRQAGDTYSMYTLPHEFTPTLLFNRPGLLCVSNTTNDATARAKPTRIFFTVKEQDRWNLVYAPFGEIIEGLAVAKGLSEGETIDRVTVEGDRAAIESLRIRFARDLAEWNRAIDAVATQPSR